MSGEKTWSAGDRERRADGRRETDMPVWAALLQADIRVLIERTAALDKRQDTHETVCTERHTSNVTQTAAAFRQINDLRKTFITGIIGMIGALFGVCMLLAKMLAKL